MSEQPEALRLAELCRSGALINDEWDEVAAELLRLHAVESGAKVELMRRDNLIDSLHGLCESYRTQVESLQADPRIGKCQACGHECEVCHSQNASQTPQTGLSLMAAPQEWSPAYTRGPARQSAPVAAVPALVPMHSEAVGELAEKYAYRDFTNDYPQTIDDLVRDVEAHHRIGLAVGDGAQPIKDTP
jgi:hypothetical protein